MQKKEENVLQTKGTSAVPLSAKLVCFVCMSGKLTWSWYDQREDALWREDTLLKPIDQNCQSSTLWLKR